MMDKKRSLKMKTSKMIFFLFFGVIFITANASVLKETRSSGRVKSFDKKTVTLVSNDLTWVVPRESIAEHFKIKPGAHVESIVKTDKKFLDAIEKARINHSKRKK